MCHWVIWIYAGCSVHDFFCSLVSFISSCFRNTVYNICGSKQLWGNDGNVFNFNKFQEHPEQEAEVEAQCTGACYWDVCGYDIIYLWVRLSRKVKDRVSGSSGTWKLVHVVSLLPSWVLLAQERLILLCFRLYLFVLPVESFSRGRMIIHVANPYYSFELEVKLLHSLILLNPFFPNLVWNCWV